VHCTPEFSATWYEREDADVIDEVITELADTPAFSGVELATGSAILKRWRYARPVNTLDVHVLVVPGNDTLLIAGDAVAGARVEGAALSGFAAADALR
jgi:predicted NAD/FAD-dependent oxidoreductase